MSLSAMGGVRCFAGGYDFWVFCEGAPAQRSPLMSKDRQCLACSAHFSERGGDEKDTTLCMATSVATELKELSKRKENEPNWHGPEVEH